VLYLRRTELEELGEAADELARRARR